MASFDGPAKPAQRFLRSEAAATCRQVSHRLPTSGPDRWFGAAAAGVVGWLLMACSPVFDWREVTPEGAEVVAMFPCAPDRFERPVALAGAPVRMQMWVCDAGGATFALGFFEVADPGAVNAALQRLRGAAAANIGAHPTALAASASVPGMTPAVEGGRIELAGHLPDGTAVTEQAVLFSKGLRVFQASVIGSKPVPEAAANFFAGLRFPS